MIKLGIDAMGSDKGSSIMIEPVKRFVKEYDAELYVYGNKDELKELENTDKVHLINTTEVMLMEDGPLAVRRKKDSSMVRAMQDLADGLTDGVVSAGSTGALFSSGMMLVKPLGSKENRGAILTLIPSNDKPVCFMDMGANAEVSAEDLVHFALIGKTYYKIMENADNPSVALLNIGSEAKKGDTIRKEAYELLNNDTRINFFGNLEANHILDGKANVIVTDGFTGNIAEKTLEGTASFLMKQIKSALMSSFTSKIGALLIKKSLYKVKDLLNPDKYGGALIAGLNKPVVKAHGSSDSEAMYNAFKQLYNVCLNDICGKIKEELG